MNIQGEWKPAEPGVQRKITTVGKGMMSMLVKFEEGAEGYVHSHPHEQLTYVAYGEMEFRIGDKLHIVKEGESIYIPSEVEHGVRALRPSMLFDTFTPIREDLLAKDGYKL